MADEPKDWQEIDPAGEAGIGGPGEAPWSEGVGEVPDGLGVGATGADGEGEAYELSDDPDPWAKATKVARMVIAVVALVTLFAGLLGVTFALLAVQTVLVLQDHNVINNRPRRVVVTDEGVELEARKRTVAIEWSDLIAVKQAPNRLRWSRQGGNEVVTSDRFVGLERLLGSISQRAPHVRITD